MLTIYRRHRPECTFFGKGRNTKGSNNCAKHCPIWVQGSLAGEYVRRTLNEMSWQGASNKIAKWNASGEIGVETPDIPTISEAVEKFLHDLEHGQKRKPPTIKTQKHLLEKRLLVWCAKKGIKEFRQLDVDAVRTFRSTWPDAPLTAFKNLERLRSFFRFCFVAAWINKNPAESLKVPNVGKASERVKVFTDADLKNILAACDRYPTHNAYGHDNPERVRTFVLTLRYSGLRIRDCVGLRRDSLTGDKLSLNTQKTGTPVFMPVPAEVVEGLTALPEKGEYFFWTGNGQRKSAVARRPPAFSSGSV